MVWPLYSHTDQSLGGGLQEGVTLASEVLLMKAVPKKADGSLRSEATSSSLNEITTV